MQKTELKFNSQVCTTKEQSQRLLDLGLKPETADMYHTTFYRDNVGYKMIQVRNEKLPLLSQELPAWSLHRLIELMDVYEVILEWKFGIYECAISMLEERIKDGLINKEYLKL